MEGLLIAVLWALVYIAVLALVIYVVIWVLGQLGVVLPPHIVKILWVIVALIALIIIVRVLLGAGPGLRLGQGPPHVIAALLR